MYVTVRGDGVLGQQVGLRYPVDVDLVDGVVVGQHK